MLGRQSIGVGLIGCGTVGSGVVKLLLEEADLYADRLGRPVELRSVLVREEDRHYKTEQVPEGKLIHDVEAFFADDSIDIVIELAGGTGAAREFVSRALTAGKHIVTANKALLAAHGPELFALARKHNVAIGFEASCAGGIPIITAIQFGLSANRINDLYGILNGTCNYILTEMAAGNKPYDTALGEAQEKGFAEADPTLDVSGGDTAHKLAIFASLIFGVAAHENDVACEGIEGVDLADIRFGMEMGYQMKLLAIAQRTGGGLSLRVHPCFIDADELLAQVRGSFNALSVFGHAVGHTLYYGRGAGQMPTASAVVADLLNIADGWYAQAFAGMRLWPDQFDPPSLIDPDQLRTRYYLRISAKDQPGVLAEIAAILGRGNISIAAVMQHEKAAGQFVPLVITTHDARDGDVRRAVEQIADLDVVDGQPVSIRIVDLPTG